MSKLTIYIRGWSDEKRDPNYPSHAITKLAPQEVEGSNMFGYNGRMTGYNAGLQIDPEGYFIPFGDLVVCAKCQRPIEHVSTSTGSSAFSAMGGLQCDCSLWECAASPFSGSVYPDTNWKRVRIFTSEDRVRQKLATMPDEERLALKKVLEEKKP